jgi:hypothetical protein
MTSDVDGIMWGSERQGALSDSLGAMHDVPPIDPGRVTCFCEFCQSRARRSGINVERARQGFLELETFVRSARSGQQPVAGYYVQFCGSGCDILNCPPGKCSGPIVSYAAI